MNVSREEVAALKRWLQDRQEERRAEADIDKAISLVNRHREARRQGAGQDSGSPEKVDRQSGDHHAGTAHEGHRGRDRRHRCRRVGGVYGDGVGLVEERIRKPRHLAGRVGSPYAAMSSASSS